MKRGRAIGLFLLCVAERLRANGAEDGAVTEALASNGPLGDFLRDLDEDDLDEFTDEVATAISAAAGTAARGSPEAT
jgi:hypothetical protein